MKVTPFVIKKQIDDAEVILHPTLLQVNNKNYLVDCGYEATFDSFAAALNDLNAPIESLHGLILSHDDIDHLEALHLFKKQNKQLRVYCSRIEEPSISGKVKSERLVQAEGSFSRLPETHKAWAANFIRQLKDIKRLEVDETLEDGDSIEAEIKVIHTPGHTRGHISLYIPQERTVIANDAVVLEQGVLNIANPAYTLDIGAAILSVEKIRNLNPERLICYHGGALNNNVSERLQALVYQYQPQ